SETTSSDTMTPPRRTRTPMAAIRVVSRNALSSNPIRASTLCRATGSDTAIRPLCNAMSATDPLLSDIGALLNEHRRAHSSGPHRGTQGVSLADGDRTCGKRKRRRMAPFPVRLVGLDVARPDLLDLADDLVRHRNVI